MIGHCVSILLVFIIRHLLGDRKLCTYIAVLRVIAVFIL